MRKLNIFLALAFLLTSCVVDDDLQYIDNQPIDVENGIKIFGAVQDFDIRKVTTRADNGSGELPSDSFISEMTMFVFKANGDIVQGYSNRTVNTYDDKTNADNVTYSDNDKCSSAINLQKANPTFLIDTQDGLIASLEGDDPTIIFYDHKATDLTACKIYIVANAWHVLEGKLNNIKTLADLEAITMDIDESLSMPKKDDGHYRGFPMIGTHHKFANNEGADTFDLSKNGENKAGAVAKIPLKKLYSKVSFSIQVNANEVISTPKFKIEKAEVFNVPKKAHLGRDLDSNGKPDYSKSDDYIIEMTSNSSYNPEDFYHFTETPAEITTFSRTDISHTTQKKLTEGSEYLIEFSFYMPEHKVTPNANSQTFEGYPEDIDEDLKQYYKPDLVGAIRNGDGTTQNSKYATFVRIHGKYYDHNGQIKDVRYDVYLGQNNTDDFTVKRNQLLTNKLVITGLTNYHDAYTDVEGNISIDHRVDVDYAGFNLSMERTAILDSHFEVRPLDIELSPGSTMVITIPEDYRKWVGMESDAARYGDNGKYVNTGDRKAVRKYFTTNLVTELNATSNRATSSKDGAVITAEGPKITITYNGEGTKIFRLWFYIDENPNVYDKLGKDKQSTESGDYSVGTDLYRICPVQFKYTGTDFDAPAGGNATINKTVTINFQQWNLWRVWNANGDRYYDIEHEEEYLNNYASDMHYGGTQDGMAYGLEGIQLSKNVPAYWAEKIEHDTGSGLGASILEWIVGFMDNILNFSSSSNSIFAKSGKNPYFDFYLSRDNFPVNKLDSDVDKTKYTRDYQGIEFNKEIAATLKASSNAKAKIDGVTLTEDPISAFSYCYNKNKRNANGEVVDQKWYLPAIDEIEEIALGAYDEFDRVFQNKKYWSCQPAYEPNTVIINPIYYTWILFGSTYINYSDYITMEGQFYNENLTRARSTSVFTTDGRTYQNIQSGVPNNVSSGTLSVDSYIEGDRNGETVTRWTQSNIDYSSAIFANPDGEYRGNTPRTEKCRIRAVYRSGTK